MLVEVRGRSPLASAAQGGMRREKYIPSRLVLFRYLRAIVASTLEQTIQCKSQVASAGRVVRGQPPTNLQ